PNAWDWRTARGFGGEGELIGPREFIITHFTEKDCVWTRLLPLERKEDSIEWYSAAIIYEDSLLDTEAHLTVPRMLRYTMLHRGYYMTRRAKSFQIEYDFYRTPQGRRRWAAALI